MQAVASEPTRTWPRLAWMLAPAVVFVAILGIGLLRQTDPPAVGDPAPPIEQPLLNGEDFSLAELRGKPVMLNFWASWCLPCEDEAPFLSRGHELYGDKVHFVGVNVRDATDDALAFASGRDLDYLHVKDDNDVLYNRYGLTGQPETFFLDEEGRVLAHIQGPLTEESFMQYLDSLAAR